MKLFTNALRVVVLAPAFVVWKTLDALAQSAEFLAESARDAMPEWHEFTEAERYRLAAWVNGVCALFNGLAVVGNLAAGQPLSMFWSLLIGMFNLSIAVKCCDEARAAESDRSPA